ncbi:MAG: hypothetical protein ACRCX8_01810 [Sarcina sp.]
MEVKYCEGNIREYDLSSANASILVSNDYISEDMYYDLIEGDKKHRNKIIGLLIKKHPEVYEDILKVGVKDCVDKFVKFNGLKESNILEISQDAIFTIDVKGTKETKLKLSFGDYINFVPKHDYLSMFEFSPKDGASTMLKIYLVLGENKVKMRFARLDRDNFLYDMIVDLMRFIYNGNRNKFLKTLREMVMIIKKGKCEDVCTGCSNERLLDAFRELATL